MSNQVTATRVDTKPTDEAQFKYVECPRCHGGVGVRGNAGNICRLCLGKGKIKVPVRPRRKGGADSSKNKKTYLADVLFMSVLFLVIGVGTYFVWRDVRNSSTPSLPEPDVEAGEKESASVIHFDVITVSYGLT